MSARTTAAAKGLLLSSVALIAGCAAVPELGDRPELSAPTAFASDASFAAAAGAWPSDRWWESYGDPQLNALIEEALAGSPSLEAAAARLRRAEAAAQQAGAARMPAAAGEAAVQGSRQDLSADNLPDVIRDAVPDDWSTRSSVSLELSYQLDFFGRNRAAFTAATSHAEAAGAEAAAARLQVSAAVALVYADLLRLFADRGAAEDIVRLRYESAALVAQREGNGLENEGPVHQAESELARARADLVAIDAAIARTRNAIAALLGAGPDRGLTITAPDAPRLAALSAPDAIGLDLIGRRPDLVAARLHAEAAAARIDVARADFYLNVNLAAVIGIQTLGLDRLDGGELGYARVGPAVSLPIFSGGRLEGAYRGAHADYAEAVALYDQAVADAFREVADAISDRRYLDEQLVQEQAALEAAEAAYRVARDRYEGGLESYIDTLSVENGLVAQRRAVADLQASVFALDVELVRALGGGFRAS